MTVPPLPTVLEGTRYSFTLILKTPEEIIGKLTPKQRDVCAAVFYDRKTHRLVGLRLGISRRAVGRLISRAKAVLIRQGVDVERLSAA